MSFYPSKSRATTSKRYTSAPGKPHKPRGKFGAGIADTQARRVGAHILAPKCSPAPSVPAPRPRPTKPTKPKSKQPNVPPMYWDAERGEWISTVSQADYDWHRLHVVFAAEEQAADREEALREMHYQEYIREREHELELATHSGYEF
jgi:hypothetical protein